MLQKWWVPLYAASGALKDTSKVAWYDNFTIVCLTDGSFMIALHITMLMGVGVCGCECGCGCVCVYVEGVGGGDTLAWFWWV